MYMKKQQLNRRLYYLHLSMANTWGNTWQYIRDTIEMKLKKQIRLKYETLDKKLQRLSQEQIKTPNEHHNFYPIVVNNTNITFTKNETALLEKGLKYNLHNKKKNCLTILALEAETAISSVPITDREYYRKKVSDHIEKLKHQKTRPQPQQSNRIQHHKINISQTQRQ